MPRPQRHPFLTPTLAIQAAALALVLLPALHLGADDAKRIVEQHTAAKRALLNQYPGARIQQDSRLAVMAVYGRPMTAGSTPASAADQWMASHADLLGIDSRELSRTSQIPLGRSRQTVLTFHQTMDGLPVEDAFARVVVRLGTPHRVVYVGSKLARSPQVAFKLDEITATSALDAMQRSPAYADLDEWGAPKLVILTHEAAGFRIATHRAWKIQASGERFGMPRAYTLFVDAASGKLIEARDAIERFSVTGRVSAFLTPGTRPDLPDNRPAETPLPGVRVASPTGTTAFANQDGNYTVSTNTQTNGLVEADLVGRRVSVRNMEGNDLFLESDVLRFLPQVDFLFNAANRQFDTAQVNAFHHVTQTGDFYIARQPDFTALNLSLDTRVNVDAAGDCAALFHSTDLFILFTQAGDGCANAAFSTVVSHEYGHFIANRLGFASPQLSFGEGFADTVATLVHNDSALGRDFRDLGTTTRNAATANQQYPCSGSIHTCGQVLSGVWWDTKLALQASLGTETGLALARQLFTDWSRITTGGSGEDSAHPQTGVEMLVADDDDDNLDTLTPHYREICSALQTHNIPCPIADCNNNGFDDSHDIDIASGFSSDCTGNGIPDECEPDCNANNRADSCDIADGTLSDNDHNTIPDECRSTLVVPSATFPTIQSAIDEAHPGDLITVAPGTYTGDDNKNLDFGGKILELRCERPGDCVIDCEGDGRGFFFHQNENETSILDGFTIINGLPKDKPLQGGGIYCFSSHPLIRNCRLLQNRTTGNGGGLWCEFANPRLENCILAENSSGKTGGGVGLNHANTTFLNCTITDNNALRGVGLHLAGESHPVLSNCIVWTDRPGTSSDIDSFSGRADVSYSILRGDWPGAGNRNVNPGFVDPNNGDWRLKTGSPLVNRGDPTDSKRDGLDADGSPRVQGCRIDIGALESSVPQLTGDFNADNQRDLRDLSFFQLCFDAAVGNPTWREACECVFDANGDLRVDNADLPNLLNGLDGP